jgi:hypothetical protein
MIYDLYLLMHRISAIRAAQHTTGVLKLGVVAVAPFSFRNFYHRFTGMGEHALRAVDEFLAGVGHQSAADGAG